MATAIEWTDETWNPLAGCKEVSPGCANCYAAGMAHRLAAMAEADIAAGRDPGRKRHYIGLTEKRGGKVVWTGKINLITEALGDPLGWKKPRRVFVNSMSDLFHEAVPFRFIDQVFCAMAMCPQHTFQVLTKRPDRMARYLHPSNPPDFYYDEVLEQVALLTGVNDVKCDDRWPLPNVWLGTSVESQKEADERIPHLLNCPASVRFLSCEPLLGPVKLPFTELAKSGVLRSGEEIRQLHWVIVGGESGHNARPMHPDWARSLRDQCQAAGVPFFFKQFGEWSPFMDPEGRETGGGVWLPDGRFVDPYESDSPEWPAGVAIHDCPAMFRVGKKLAGRELDGRTWDEFPEVPVAKERGILFSELMVKAIMAGQKLQTRRTINPQYACKTVSYGCIAGQGFGFIFTGHDTVVKCPYGSIGDKLWVRETHYRFGHWEPETGKRERTRAGRQRWKFVADSDEVRFDAPAEFRKGRHHKDPSTPAWHKRLARFMPRKFCRTLLEITDVRVERLNDISIQDAHDEGIQEFAREHKLTGYWTTAFARLWDKINGKGAWDANPWVWAVKFKRVEVPRA